MSDTEDPIVLHLRDRKRELEDRINDASARLGEIDGLLAALADGRTRVRRRLKEVPTDHTKPRTVTLSDLMPPDNAA